MKAKFYAESRQRQIERALQLVSGEWRSTMQIWLATVESNPIQSAMSFQAVARCLALAAAERKIEYKSVYARDKSRQSKLQLINQYRRNTAKNGANE